MTYDGKLCVVTIHGIGFQQPPGDGIPGYADGIHQNLARELGGTLGGDPRRPDGPVYVMSSRPGTRNTEWGLSRLGTWRPGGDLDITNAPLTAGDERVAHVAVVYNSLEGLGPQFGTGTGTLVHASLMAGHYASLAGAFRLAVGDAWAALHEHPDKADVRASPSLSPRNETGHKKTTKGMIATLEDDVIAYVCRNDLRGPIRDFITEVLRRVEARPDVARVVVNAHSQGTVVAFDVLKCYPAEPRSKVTTLVTMGSPLRKYATFFSWGNDAGGISAMKWLNFWDAHDPVADPLDPPEDWRFGDEPARKPGQLGLLWSTDAAGDQVPVPIADRQVDNLRHSVTGSLRAHDYWGNAAEVAPALAGVLKDHLAPAAGK